MKKPSQKCFPVWASIILTAVFHLAVACFSLSYGQTINASASCGQPTIVTYSINYSGGDQLIGVSWSIDSGSGSLTDNGSNATVDWSTTGTVKAHYALQETSPPYTVHEGDTYSTYTVYTAGTASYTWTRCYDATGTLSITASDGTITWQKCTSGCSSINDTGWSTTTNTFTNLSVTTYFRVKLTGACGTAYSNTLTVPPVYSPFNPGSIPNPVGAPCLNQAVTIGSGVLASGGNGSISYQWQVNTGTGFQNISGATSASHQITAGSIPVDKQYIYRRLSKSQDCPASWVESNSVTVSTMRPGPATPQNFSALYNSSIQLTATGAASGEIYKWYDQSNNVINCSGNCPDGQGSYSNCTGLCNIANATSPYYYVGRYNPTTGCETPLAQRSLLTISIYLNEPPAPTISANTCGPKKVTLPAPPTGVTWYWQGSDLNGESTGSQLTTPADDPGSRMYTFNTGPGPYYVRGKVNSLPVWSPSTIIPAASAEVSPVDLLMTSYHANSTLVQATHSITLSSDGGGFTIPAGSTFTARIAITSECNDVVNWTESIVYDADGVPVTRSKSYFDGLGNALLNQSTDRVTQKVFASQPLYNTYGMAVAETLPAPILEHDFIYKNNFVRTETGDPYIADDFDLRTTTNASQSGEINEPKRVGDQPGTLGWYYSASNNLEANTPVTDFPYSRTFSLEGPDPTVTTSAGPGDIHRMGGGHEVKNERQLIGANDLDHYLSLRSNFVTSSLPVTGYKYITTDPDGKKTVSFVDADGRSLASATLTGSTLDNWSYSYYNDLGQLVASVAPNGVNTGSTAPPSFVTTYKYDQLGRLIETRSPDEGTSQFVYSTDGKIRFSQNQVQSEATPERFSYTNYDYLGRLIESGEYTTGTFIFEPHSIPTTPASNSVLNIIDNVGQATGISKKISAEVANCTDYAFIEYDYENFAGITNPPASFQANLDGQVSRTENENAITLYSYNEFGQVIKTWQLIKVVNPPVAKTIEYAYDYFGNVTEVAYEKDSADSFYHHYSYDANQRLTDVFTSKDGVNKTLRAKYEYYLHGPLKRIELFDGDEELQGIDYTYTINGALKTINHADPSKDPASDGNDVFGETLEYFDNDYDGADYTAGTQTISGFDNQYGGLLKAMSWHSPAGNHEKQTYAYDYDDRNQLQNALWGTMTGSAGSYGFSQASPQSYREGVPSYDKNGNIQSLVRNDKLGAAIANYGYVYESNKNRLDKVNHNSSLLIDYSYNSIGQMTRQVEGEKDFDIIYNAYGLVSEIRDNLNGDDLIQKYLYDDRGNLLQKILYNDGDPTLYTTYVSDVAGNVLGIYQHTTTAMASEQAEVPIYGAGRFAVYKPTSNTYFYEISDHLGNVRAVIGSEEVDTYSTNMESPTSSDFSDYDPHYDDFMDHTDTGTTYAYSELLSGGYADKVGLSRSLAVSPGDVIKVEAYGKYRTVGGSEEDLGGFALALTGAFGLTSNLPGDPGLAYDALETYGLAVEGGFDHPDDPNAPKAYLNILLFDKNFNFVDAAYRQIDADFDQVGTSTKDPHDYLVREVTITEPGYAFIFFSNESIEQVDVHFDDVTITHTHSNIVAGADYYPYGLAMDGREIDDEPYRYGYQGQFSEKDVTTGMQEFELRMYDPRIGRWLSPDPFAQYYSTYKAVGNNPVMRVDPNGGFDLGGILPEVVVSATSFTTIAVQATKIVGTIVSSARVFCSKCPDPHWSGLEKGSIVTFEDGTEYILDDPSRGQDGWTRTGGQLDEVTVTPSKTFWSGVKRFGAGMAGPMVDVVTTAWTSTRNGFHEYFSDGSDKYDQWHSYKIDEEGFYEYTDKYGNIPAGPERSRELISNTIQANIAIYELAVPPLPVSYSNPLLQGVGDFAVKTYAGDVTGQLIDNALSVH